MTGPFSWSIWASTWPNVNHSSVHIYGLAVSLKISDNTDPDIDVFYIPRAAFARPVGAMHAGGQGGSNKQKRRRRRRKVSNTKPLQIKEETRSPSLAPTLYPSNLLCSQLPAPAIRRGATGGHIGAIFRSHGPLFSPQPLKSCTAMCMALMFALYPTCKAIIIHASWQSQALSLLHLQLFALGYDMTVRLISSLLHIAPRVSLSFCFSALRLCTTFESNSDLTTWKIFYLSKPVWHLCRFDAFGSSPDNSRYSRRGGEAKKKNKNVDWCLTHVSAQVCFARWCFFSQDFFSRDVWDRKTLQNQKKISYSLTIKSRN